MADPDMLHHADGNHSVKSSTECAIVDLAEFHEVGDTHLLGAFTGNLDLFGGDVDRDDACAGSLGDVNGKGAPARPDFGDGHSRPETQFGSCPYQLVALGVLQRLMLRVCEEGAGIIEVIIEKQPIDIGGDVVVMPRIRGSDTHSVCLVPAPQTQPDLA